MRHGSRQTAGLAVLLTVGCGIALQLSLMRHGLMLLHPGVAFSTLAGHIGGWGLGLGLAPSVPARLREPALAAAGAGCIAWLGVALFTAAGPAVAGFGVGGFLWTACASGVLTGLSVAWALARCERALDALAGDLAGVALGAALHVAVTSMLPRLPSPLLWIGLLALSELRAGPRLTATTLLLGAALLVPLEHPGRLARADSPLGEALRARGLDAWLGAFYDADGRVDAVTNPGHGGVELYINGGTQAQTPAPTGDRVTLGIAALLEPASALVLGAGGLADVAALLESGAERVVAVERSEAVLAAARAVAPDARALLEDGRVEVVRREARRFLAAQPERFDLVLLPLSYAAAGIAPAGLMFYPSYLFTVEGILEQAEAAAPDGGVCFVLPFFELRDRVLATLGAIEERRGGRPTLFRRLWVAENPGRGAYSDVVCWAPHAPLPEGRTSAGLRSLHEPGRPESAQLRARLAGTGTLPPAWDRRPYFFDLDSLRPAGPAVPPELRGLLLWTPLALVVLALGLWRRLRARAVARSPTPSALAVAALTGAAFPALEYLVLSIARGSGLSEGLAYASASVSFAAAGLVGMAPVGGVRARAVVGAGVMGLCAVFFARGGITALFSLGGVVWLVGPALMLIAMSAGAATFAALFRAVHVRAGESADVRPLFLASALGTLAAVVPVLLIELRFGGAGCALAAAAAYAVAAAAAGARRPEAG